MIGRALKTHTAEEGDQAKRGTAVDGLGILLYLYMLRYIIYYYLPIFLSCFLLLFWKCRQFSWICCRYQGKVYTHSLTLEMTGTDICDSRISYKYCHPPDIVSFTTLIFPIS